MHGLRSCKLNSLKLEELAKTKDDVEVIVFENTGPTNEKNILESSQNKSLNSVSDSSIFILNFHSLVFFSYSFH